MCTCQEKNAIPGDFICVSSKASNHMNVLRFHNQHGKRHWFIKIEQSFLVIFLQASSIVSVKNLY